MSSSTQWLQVGTMVPVNSPCLHGLGLQPPHEMEQPGPGASLKSCPALTFCQDLTLDLKGHGKHCSSLLTGI